MLEEHIRLLDGCWDNLKRSSDESFGMARLGPGDISTYNTYDGYSFHLPMNLEGFGFCERGEAFDFIKDGNIELGGELPCNTSGGMLSESYMHGANHQVEMVHQLRHEAGKQKPQMRRPQVFAMVGIIEGQKEEDNARST